MAKKPNLQEASQKSAGIVSRIAKGEPVTDPEPVNTQRTKGTKNAKPGYYRFNLNMPIEFENYLKTAAYNASIPGHMVSVTEYICNLIQQDMNDHMKKNLDTQDNEHQE